MNEMSKNFKGKWVPLCCAVILMFATILSGCSIADNKEGEGKKVTLRFSWWGGESRHKATLAAMDTYMKLHPNVKIEGEYSTYDGYYQKLLTQFAGKTAPDIVQMDYSWINDLVKQSDLLVDLYSMKDNLNISGFDDKFMRDWAFINNKLQAVPTGSNIATAIVNETFMEREGLPLNIEWTWEKILEEGKKLHQKNPKLYLINSDLITLADKIVPPYYNQLTGKDLVNPDYTVAFDQKGMTETFAFIKRLYDDGILQPLGESALYNAKTEQNPKWINGETGFTFANTSDILKHQNTAAKFKVGATLFPIKENAKASGIYPKPAQLLGINKDSKNVQEAAKFVNWFFNDKEAVLTVGVERSVPAMPAAQKILVDNNKMDKVVASALETGIKHKTTTPNFINFDQELYKIMNEVVERVAFAKVTPEAGAAELSKRFEDKLKELKAASK
jgi:oligogalacturonide transport system substrate-binding protein